MPVYSLYSFHRTFIPAFEYLTPSVWPVETKYKELKSRLAIEDFNGATSVSVFQEFYISMLLSNLSSLIKNDVDQQLRISSKSSNKHRY